MILSDTTLIAAAALVALVAWIAQRRRRPPPRPDRRDVDHAELEAAEREVRDLDAATNPDDGFSGDDWGPGAGGRRP